MAEDRSNPDGPELGFNPENETGFGAKVIWMEGREVVIHDTNNFPVLFDAFMHKVTHRRPMNTLEKVYLQSLEEGDGVASDLLHRFLKSEYDLFGRLGSFTRKRDKEFEIRQRMRNAAEKRPQTQPQEESAAPDEEELMAREYYYSQAFDAIAAIAQSIHPDYDLRRLCR